MLWGNSSYATTTVQGSGRVGSGRVVFGAVGDDCDGWPAVGTHQLRFEFLNDYAVSGRCDRNVALGYARMEREGAGFVHPGISVGRSQLDLIKARVAAGQEPWKSAYFSTMLTDVLLPLTIDNWTGGGANWLLSTTDATIAIGVFTDDRAVYDNGIGGWRGHVPSAYYLSTDKPTQPQLAGSPVRQRGGRG